MSVTLRYPFSLSCVLVHPMRDPFQLGFPRIDALFAHDGSWGSTDEDAKVNNGIEANTEFTSMSR